MYGSWLMKELYQLNFTHNNRRYDMHTEEELKLYNKAVTDSVIESAKEVALLKLSPGWGNKSQCIISDVTESVCNRLFPKGTVLADYRPAEVYVEVCELLEVDPDLNYSHPANKRTAGYEK